MGYRRVSKGLGIVFNQVNKEEYSILLSDSRWSNKRNKILARDLFECKICGSHEKLEVHHLYYVVDHKPWEYPNDVLVTWCDKCHEQWHKTHPIIVRDKVYSKGKKNKYEPLKKQSHSKKNATLRGKVKRLVPKKEYRVIWDTMRHMNTKEEKMGYLEILKTKYSKTKK